VMGAAAIAFRNRKPETENQKLRTAAMWQRVSGPLITAFVVTPSGVICSSCQKSADRIHMI